MDQERNNYKQNGEFKPTPLSADRDASAGLGAKAAPSTLVSGKQPMYIAFKIAETTAFK